MKFDTNMKKDIGGKRIFIFDDCDNGEDANSIHFALVVESKKGVQQLSLKSMQAFRR